MVPKIFIHRSSLRVLGISHLQVATLVDADRSQDVPMGFSSTTFSSRCETVGSVTRRCAPAPEENNLLHVTLQLLSRSLSTGLQQSDRSAGAS
ncbi:MarR family transcriptional regulator [Anopheles sinensis]|uniref:MarR family transcriptional regulator n=1 Tax=Anopheles sinensis TaxID=74873 RepID=A0A084VZH2_ANOSI|nr:MarR family transcriptional regulator [Anopheles sinensis]